MNTKHLRKKDKIKRLESESSPLPAVIQNEKGYTLPPPGTASLSHRSYMAASPPPQRASWCCLSSWRESAWREREKKKERERELCQQPPCSLTSQAHLLKDQQDS